MGSLLSFSGDIQYKQWTKRVGFRHSCVFQSIAFLAKKRVLPQKQYREEEIKISGDTLLKPPPWVSRTIWMVPKL